MTDNASGRGERTLDQIRPAGTSDLEGMKAVWRETFGDGVFGGALTEQYLAWFDRNPHRDPESVSHWVGERDGRIVGAWSAMPVRLVVKGVEIAACWAQNAAVVPSARGLHLARKLFRSIRDRHQLTLGVGVTSHSRPLLASENAQLVRADQYAVLRSSPRNVMRNILREVYHRRFRSAWAGVRDAVRLLRVLRAAQPGVQVVEVARFGAEIDGFISHVTAAIPVMTHRSAEKLNWMIENPRFDCLALLATRGGRPCGCSLVRRDGKILDLLTHPDDPEAFAAILKAIVAWSNGQAIPEIAAVIPGVRKLADMYVSSGFRRNESIDFGLFYVFPDNERRDETLTDPASWYLSLADSDLWSWGL